MSARSATACRGSATPGGRAPSLGELATITFFGRIATDFSVAGTWTTIVRPDAVDAYYPPSPDGPVRFLIEFDPELGTVSELVLTGYDPGPLSLEFPIPYPSQVLRWVGPLPGRLTRRSSSSRFPSG